MHNQQEIIVIQGTDTSNFITYRQSNSARYVNYLTDSSVIPCSLDQITKDHVILNMPIQEYILAPKSLDRRGT